MILHPLLLPSNNINIDYILLYSHQRWVYYVITHMAGGRQICPDYNFLILRQIDLKLGMHLYCRIAIRRSAVH